MKTRKSSLLMTMFCCFLMVVFCGVSVYAVALQYNQTNTFSVSFVPDSVTGEISATATGFYDAVEDNSYTEYYNSTNANGGEPIYFDAYNASTETATLTTWTLGSTGSELVIDPAIGEVTLTITITNLSGVSMLIDISAITYSNFNITAEAATNGDSPASLVVANLAAGNTDLTVYAKQGETTYSTVITVKITPPNVSEVTGSVSFSINMRGN